MRASAVIWAARIWKLRSRICLAALSLGCSFGSPASAAIYTASNETELRVAIGKANADGDASATIRLTGNFTVTDTPLPTPVKPMTIDAQGFTLTGVYNAANVGTRGAITYNTLFPTGAQITLSGVLVGGSAGPAGATQGQMALSLSRATAVNNGTITGGAGGGVGGAGAAGVRGVTVSLTNNGTIQGGDSPTSGGGAGVDIAGTTGTSTLVNNGTIRGGAGPGNGPTVGVGLLVRVGTGTIVNTGTIEGGAGARAIHGSTASGNIELINSGTIRAGAGQAAIVLTAGATNFISLELQPGSVIDGNVIANAGAANDIFRLGGTGNDSFDISRIGAAAQYRNFDTFEKIGSSKWTLTGTDASATNWTIYDGTLAVNGTVGGTIDVQAAGRLQGIGQVGTTTSAGTIAPGNSIGTLTIAGNYTGTGGTLEIESVLGGDASPSDRLVVTGNTAGTTDVKVINLGGGGAQTVEGIKIVDVGGISAGSFSLQGDYLFEGDQAVVGGAYAYRLYQNGLSTPADGDWYLRSTALDPSSGATGPLYAPGVPLYEAYAGVVQSLNEFGTLRQRTGGRGVEDGRSADEAANDQINGQGSAIWTRIDGTHSHFEPETSTTGTEYDVNSWTMQAGVDGMLRESEAGILIGGVSFHVDTASADISSRFGKGDIDTTGYGFDGTLTWYGNNGFYVDTQAGVTWYESDLKSSTLHTTLADGNDGFGYGLSVEAGQKIALTDQWSLTPQVQLAYSSVRFDDFTDAYGAAVSLDDGDSLTGRLGISADYDRDWKDASGRTSRAKLYGIANLYYDFLDGSNVDVSGTSLVSENHALWGGLGMGGSLSWADDRYAAYGEAFARTSLQDFGDSNAFGAKVGFSVKW
ncbi:autotransporter outer membrane beta-barrel domain-containing protein [Rhizobium ruizarguesonis]|nr:autotransporter outer membrane beta-barrel domain-containing protein [Rhizobium ruizarguesonis]